MRVRYKPWSGPSVIVLMEKHERRYFPASTEGEFLKSCLFILSERDKSGDYYYPPYESEAPVREITFEQIKDLPDTSKLKALYAKQEESIHEYETSVREYDSWVARKNKALAVGDGLLAWGVLRERDDYEYEGISLELLEDIGE